MPPNSAMLTPHSFIVHAYIELVHAENVIGESLSIPIHASLYALVTSVRNTWVESR